MEPMVEMPNDNTAELVIGTQIQRGFVVDNVLHDEIGDIHFSSYIPETYDGTEPYALFLTLPGWEGLYFQGVGTNLLEDFGTEAILYNEKMIVLSTQLDDWGNTSAEMAIALTEYFISHYNIDESRVYLHGMSGGGETGSLVMEKRPELYAGYLMTSSKWDGNLERLVQTRTPIYFVIGDQDSYYGSDNLKQMYQELVEQYQKEGLSQEEIEKLVVLDVKEHTYFTQRGYRDEHMGGAAFAHDEEIMHWLFAQQKQ